MMAMNWMNSNNPCMEMKQRWIPRTIEDTCKKFLVWKEGNLQEFLQPSLAVEKFLEGHGQYWIERLQGGNPRYMMPHLSHSPLNVYMAVALWASNLWSWHLPCPFFFYTLISFFLLLNHGEKYMWSWKSPFLLFLENSWTFGIVCVFLARLNKWLQLVPCLKEKVKDWMLVDQPCRSLCGKC